MEQQVQIAKSEIKKRKLEDVVTSPSKRQKPSKPKPKKTKPKKQTTKNSKPKKQTTKKTPKKYTGKKK